MFATIRSWPNSCISFPVPGQESERNKINQYLGKDDESRVGEIGTKEEERSQLIYVESRARTQWLPLLLLGLGPTQCMPCHVTSGG